MAELVNIETAKEVHIPELVELLGILFAQEAEFSPNSEIQSDGLKMIITNPRIGKIYIIKNETRILGMVSILYSVSTALGAKVGMLEDMIIRPEFRGKGYGKKLIGHALKDARVEGLKRITLLTDYDNRKAINFYSSTGFEKSSMVPLRILI